MDTCLKKKRSEENSDKGKNVGFRAPELDELSSLFNRLNVHDDTQSSNKASEKSHITFFPPVSNKTTRIIVYKEGQQPPALMNLPDENQYTYKYVSDNEVGGNVVFHKYYSDFQRGSSLPFYYNDELSEFFEPNRNEAENTMKRIMRIVPYSTEEEKIQKQQLITLDDRYEYKYLNTNTELMDLCLWGYYQNFLEGISIQFFEHYEAEIPSIFFDPNILHPQIEITVEEIKKEGLPNEPEENKIERIVTRKRQRQDVENSDQKEETKRMRM